MCLAIPGKILEVIEGDVKMGKVDFSGVKKNVCLLYTPDALVGDYVVVHVGFAITILGQEQAQATLELLK
ncbi:MAG: HypC/HybG/HupF family hydrogenase formation chaperone [Verrucomicrobia bacterium]|nr:HypC/HybG/HupF family hydrogenase formation chaperone [Verrucomicrobiota bacterium]